MDAYRDCLERMEEKVAAITLTRITGGVAASASDQVACEEPLGISIECDGESGRVRRDVSVTMRTPGNDAELAIGFLFTEGIIQDVGAVERAELVAGEEERVVVYLQSGIRPALRSLDRNFYTTSSCGVCGKTSLDAVAVACPPVTSNMIIDVRLLPTLPVRLRQSQQVFEVTGGLHAAGLFSTDGALLTMREDVGRHNAVDKLIGEILIRDQQIFHKSILVLSGRISFELVQKAAMAGIPVVAAVGAPSSLAIELAQSKGICLAGFIRDDRFNVYTFADRIRTV